MHAAPRLAAAILLAAPVALAGPMTPLAGPVTPTFKTLAEVEPRIPLSAATTPGDPTSAYVISQPGSYYLTGSINAPAGKYGVRIAASNVTLDLRGFAIVAAPGGQSASGVLVLSSGATVRDGTIAGFPNNGLSAAGVSDMRAERLLVNAVGGDGIGVGDRAVVEDCSATNCGGDGIAAGDDSRILRVTASGNGGDGVDVGSGCLVEGSVASDNATAGFELSGGSLATGCTASHNGAAGFRLFDNARVVECSSGANTGDGFLASWACVIERCRANGNRGDGIVAGSHSLVVGNYCRANGSGNATPMAGIRLNNASSARVESNTCVNAPIGLKVVGSFNAIIHNACGGNSTNYDITANNRAYVIVPTLNGAAIAGSAGGSPSGTTDPFANIAY